MILFRPVFITAALLTLGGSIAPARAFYIMRYMLLEDGTTSTIVENVPEPTGGIAYVAPPADVASTVLQDAQSTAGSTTEIASASPTADANIAQSNGAPGGVLPAMGALLSSAAAAAYLAL